MLVVRRAVGYGFGIGMEKYLASLVREVFVGEDWGWDEEGLLPEHGELLTHGY
jgi:hypothetical protein